jgi:hypothetical protein
MCTPVLVSVASRFWTRVKLQKSLPRLPRLSSLPSLPLPSLPRPPALPHPPPATATATTMKTMTMSQALLARARLQGPRRRRRCRSEVRCSLSLSFSLFVLDLVRRTAWARRMCVPTLFDVIFAKSKQTVRRAMAVRRVPLSIDMARRTGMVRLS